MFHLKWKEKKIKGEKGKNEEKDEKKGNFHQMEVFVIA
jgi:hypothetical protein